MDKLKMMSKNNVDENIERIGALFPACVTEVISASGAAEKAIDFDMLKQELSSVIVEGDEERYQFTWPDKKKSILLANSPINKTLRPNRDESVDFDSTGNLYIEGDNLDVLKLLQETYMGQIKMIYIDPPYNTGNDFVYNDKFTMQNAQWDEVSGDLDDEGNRLFQNNESNGRFHTDWLNMIYPRLKVAKDLLTDDGVIFISIDDNEVENLKKVCNEIFGESNYIDSLHWKRKKQPSFLAKHTAKLMEYILIYSKNSNALSKLSIETISDETKKVVNAINKSSERIFKAGVQVKVGKTGIIEKGIYTIKSMQVEYLNDVIYEDGKTTNEVIVRAKFSVSQNLIDKFIDENLLFITANYGLRRYVSEEEKNNKKAITDLLLDWGDNQDSDREQNAIFNAKYFDYTKPTKLLYNLVRSVDINENDIVMDFFSGSATTAHAVMRLNSEDGGNRKYICVQLPEETDEKSEAFKAGYKNICEIGKERIRRAGNKLRIENAELRIKDSSNIENDHNSQLSIINSQLDTGFRVLKLDSSNMKEVYYRPDQLSQDMFQELEGNIKPDRTPEDLLFQVMLDMGVMLDSKITVNEIENTKIFVVGEQAENIQPNLVCCFDDNLTDEVVTQIAKLNPLYAVFRDSSFSSDSTATNFDQIFETYSKDTVRKVI